ncbi:cGMP-specific 3',5'-cyclic phosphodiesterase-like isoform X2 [Lineus longissimus]|uniref:cGMP-specific 3',5'-cyclic phosphodiesterase-like isoform X2 n=1 Tax=Lineus longissimus TaxID=88925 RepID=UPI00315DECBA
MAPKKKKQEVNAETVGKFLTDNPDYAREWFAKNGGSIGVATPGPSLPITVSQSAPAPANSSTLSDDDNEKEEKEALTVNLFKDYIDGTRSRKVSCRQLDVARLKDLNEQELFMELIKDIANELDVNVLCHKILMNVSILTNSDRGSLFLARGPADHRVLYSKLFDVTAVSTLEESLKAAERGFTVPFGKGIAGHVAQTKEVVNIKQAYDDPRFSQAVDKATGYRTHSILCMPILNYEEEVIGVAQIINKASGDHEFTKQDEQVFQKYLTFCGIGIMNAQLFQMSVDEYKRNKLLLRLARGIFKEQSSMDQLIRKILQEAHGLLKCERVIVHLIDMKISFSMSETNIDINPVEESGCDKTKDCKELQNMNNLMKTKKPFQKITFSQIYDMMAKDGSVETPDANLAEKWRVTHIAREIAVGQKVVNIADFEADGRFGEDAVMDDKGFVVKSLLCMPIFDSEQQVIGVAQMMNRLDGQMFAASDVNIFEAFAIFCGLGIHNTTTYESVCKLMAKQRVALEVLSYHATAPKEEVDKLIAAEIPAAEAFNLYSFTFNDIPQSDIETVYSVIRMFLDCNIPTIFHVPYDVLCRWTLSVKKNYRPVTYHNWRHAFNVAQTMFTMIFTGGMSKYLDDQEIFGLLVACLCHDLDHRGTNNAFQEKSDSPLALLYSTSTMEHHHFDQCIMILNSEGNNIFEYMSPAIYKNVIKVLENAIISTDLALYFKKRGDFQALVDAGETQWKESRKKDLLRGMMMTACDVAAITKPWEIQKEVAHLVAGEFFEQGDIEKSQLKLKPIAMMDREKKDELPKMQVGFIDAICTPIYKTLAFVEPGLKPLLEGCLNNRRNWQNLADENDGKLSTDGPGTSSGDPPSKKAKMASTEKVGSSQEERKNKINKEHGKKNGKMDPIAKIKSEEAPKKTKSTTCCLL